MNKKQAGFAILEVVLIVVILAIVGFAGYKVYQAGKNTDTTNSTPTTQSTKDDIQVTDVATAPQVQSASDLDEALTTLDQTDPGGSNADDAAVIDSDVAEF